jgi:hypothetical protein
MESPAFSALTAGSLHHFAPFCTILGAKEVVYYNYKIALDDIIKPEGRRKRAYLNTLKAITIQFGFIR